MIHSLGNRVGLIARAVPFSPVSGGRVLAVLLTVIWFVVAASAADWTKQTKLLPNASESQVAAQFGESVAIDGHIVFVGAPLENQGATDNTGAAYVFEFDDVTNTWMPRDYRLTASDGSWGDEFGNSISVQVNPTTFVNTAIIGAWRGDKPGATDAGVAYIFQDAGSGWAQVQKLSAATPAAQDYFGKSVSMSGNTAIIGAYRDDNAKGVDAGAAYIFQDSGSGWAQVGSELVASDGAAGSLFGTSVAIDGNLAVVGAFDGEVGGTATDKGAAYVFQNTGGNWVEIAKLTASDGNLGDAFGTAVAISGNTVLVGSPYHDYDPGGGSTPWTDPGAAYTFVFDGSSWTEKKLNSNDPGYRDHFGSSVDIDGNFLVVGSPHNNLSGVGNDGGSTEVFEDSGSGFTVLIPPQTADDSVPPDAHQLDQFGYAVAISNETAVVGANLNDNPYEFPTSGRSDSGSAYILGEYPAVPQPPEPPTVPEPSSLALIVLAGLCLFGLRRNRKA